LQDRGEREVVAVLVPGICHVRSLGQAERKSSDTCFAHAHYILYRLIIFISKSIQNFFDMKTFS
jgi:hypothetical protein